MAARTYTYEYSNNHNPSMPVAEVRVHRPGREQPSVTLVALIDSGSDGTMLPLKALQAVNAPFVDYLFMKGVLGYRREVETYLVNLAIGEHQIYAVEVVAVEDGDDILLGRDVLNQLEVILNGPASVSEILA